MYSKVLDEGKEIEFITQQYETGLYVAVYEDGRIADQFGTTMSDKEFHKHIKKVYKDKVVTQN